MLIKHKLDPICDSVCVFHFPSLPVSESVFRMTYTPYRCTVFSIHLCFPTRYCTSFLQQHSLQLHIQYTDRLRHSTYPDRKPRTTSVITLTTGPCIKSRRAHAVQATAGQSAPLTQEQTTNAKRHSTLPILPAAHTV